MKNNTYGFLKSNDKEVNIVVVKGFAFMLAAELVVYILNLMNIFVVEQKIMNQAFLTTAVILIIPSVIVIATKNKYNWIKYLLILSTIMFCGALYVYLTFHTIMMFAMPMVIASLYYNKRLTKFSIFFTCIFIVLSHIGSYYVMAIPEEPFRNIPDILLFGALPRVLECISFAFVLIHLANRTKSLLGKVFRHNMGLDNISEHTGELFSQRYYRDISMAIIESQFSLLDTISNIDRESSFIYSAIKINDKMFYIVDKDGKSKLTNIKDDNVAIDINGKEYSFRMFEKEELIDYDTNQIIMRFYDNGHLSGATIFKVRYDAKDEVLTKLMFMLHENIQMAIHNVNMSHDMYLTQEELVRAFAEVSESKSKQTGQHIKRVSEYAKVMADAIGLEEHEKNDLALAAMMHDIGKLLIPEAIIEKPGKLTDEEFEIIKEHVKYGYDLLKNSPGHVMELASKIALQHHERYDGTGYLGLKGEDIDYYSRIIALVDVYDALVSRRSYKSSWAPEAAYLEICNQSGKQFDPEIVELFKSNNSKFLEVLKSYPD